MNSTAAKVPATSTTAAVRVPASVTSTTSTSSGSNKTSKTGSSSATAKTTQSGTKPNPSADIYQFKVSLKNFKPPLWRRVQVPGNYNFLQFHRVIQGVMFWSDFHCHKFILGNGTTVGDKQVVATGMLNQIACITLL